MSGFEILLASGMAASIAGTVAQINTQKNIAKANAKNAEQNAELERLQSIERENVIRRNAAHMEGAQAAAIAESGIGFGGSASDIMRQSSINAEIDALTTRYEGDLRARGFQFQSSLERYSGKRNAQAGYAKLAGSILTGAATYGQNQQLINAQKPPTQAQINGIY